jgi:hypothetical protein
MSIYFSYFYLLVIALNLQVGLVNWICSLGQDETACHAQFWDENIDAVSSLKGANSIELTRVTQQKHVLRICKNGLVKLIYRFEQKSQLNCWLARDYRL